MITVKQIVSQFLKEHGFTGLYNENAPCGCDGSAPCGDGPCGTCVAAHRGPGGKNADGDEIDHLFYPDPRTLEQLDQDEKCYAREMSSKEVEFWKFMRGEK